MEKRRNRKLIQNAGWLILGRGMQCVLNMLVGLLTMRYLGPANVGLIQYGGAYTAFFASLSTLGIPSVLVKELTDHPQQEGEILGTALGLQAFSSAASAVLILGLVFLADAGEPVTLEIAALSCMAMGLRTLDTLHYWFQARMQSKVTALAVLAAFVITAAYKLVLVILKKNILWFAFATVMDQGLLGVFLLASYKRHGGRPLAVSWKWRERLLRKSCHFILPGMLVAVYGQTDRIMLKQLAGQIQLGYYASAVSLCNAWCFVLNGMIDAMYPEITRAYQADRHLFQKRNKQLYSAIFYLAAGVSLLFFFFAELAVTLLYGENYLPAASVLKILTWYTAFSYLGGARNAWVVCENRQKYLIWVYMVAAGANVALNVLLIPQFGAGGAAAASLAAQIAATGIAPWCIPGLRENARLMAQAILPKGLGRAVRKLRGKG